jgi:hypothetical protein
MAKGIIRQTGKPGDYKYFYQGKPLDLNNMKDLVEMIGKGAFSGGTPDPAVTMQAAMNLSKSRADKVKEALTSYATSLGVNVDISQITPVGAGVMEPVIAKPRNIDEAKENMRVEFRIVKVDAESIAPGDFDF